MSPTLGSAELMDEDPAEAALIDDVRPRPDGRIETVEHRQDAPGRPTVVFEQETDLVGLHCSSLPGSAAAEAATEKIDGAIEGELGRFSVVGVA